MWKNKDYSDIGRRNSFVLKIFHHIIVSAIIKADVDRPMMSQ